MMPGLEMFSSVLSLVIIAGLVVYHGSNLVMIVLAVSEVYRQRRVSPAERVDIALKSGVLPGVSVIIPAYNEDVTIIRTVSSVLALDYSEFEVIVVNDGSTDRTLGALWDEYALRPSSDRPTREIPTQRVRGVFISDKDPRLKVVDKRNGGKADALNAGICLADYPLVLAIDADVVLDTHALVHLAIPFVEEPRTIATSGMIRPQNGCTVQAGRLVSTGLPTTWLEGFQVLEYLRAHTIGRLFFNRVNAHLIISGAFGLFARQRLMEIGGYQTHAIGEDMEVVVRLHRHLRDGGVPYRITFAVDALCLTEAPHNLTEFGKQRTRWHQGLLTTLRAHGNMACRSRYGAIGWIAFPYFLLELYAPVLEGLGWILVPVLWGCGVLSGGRVALVVATSVVMSGFVSIAAIAVETAAFSFLTRLRHRLRMVWLALLEHVGYRQATVYYRVRALVRYYWAIQLRSGWTPPTRQTGASAPGRAGSSPPADAGG
jgi:cellulose synthase/poly-beta-1,6-N-acetylglucosamine synthase-like glycosyltransferase